MDLFTEQVACRRVSGRGSWQPQLAFQAGCLFFGPAYHSVMLILQVFRCSAFNVNLQLNDLAVIER